MFFDIHYTITLYNIKLIFTARQYVTYPMIEFVLKDRRLRLYPDGKITCRAIRSGKETKTEIWNEIKFGENDNGYLKCGITIDGTPRPFFKHRLLHLAYNPSWDIFDINPSNCIDHINHNRTDNTDGNLRLVTNQQNQFNRSNVKGYYWHKKKTKWRAQIKVDQKVIHLGYFVKEEDARAAYLKAKARLHIIPP